MGEGFYEPKRLMVWARAYKEEWEVVCGVRMTSTEMNVKIAKMLKEAELFELSEMMTLRAYQMMLDTWKAEGKENLII